MGGCNPGTTDEDLRKALLKFIADSANWDNAARPTYLEVSRALVKAAHSPAGGGRYEPPSVCDWSWRTIADVSTRTKTTSTGDRGVSAIAPLRLRILRRRLPRRRAAHGGGGTYQDPGA